MPSVWLHLFFGFFCFFDGLPGCFTTDFRQNDETNSSHLKLWKPATQEKSRHWTCKKTHHFGGSCSTWRVCLQAWQEILGRNKCPPTKGLGKMTFARVEDASCWFPWRATRMNVSSQFRKTKIDLSVWFFQTMELPRQKLCSYWQELTLANLNPCGELSSHPHWVVFDCPFQKCRNALHLCLFGFLFSGLLFFLLGLRISTKTIGQSRFAIVVHAKQQLFKNPFHTKFLEQ